MKTEYHLDPQIDEAITRLQQKMLDVNHSLAETKSRSGSKKSQTKARASASGKRTRRPSMFSRFMGLSLIAIISLGVASYIAPHVEQVAETFLQGMSPSEQMTRSSSQESSQPSPATTSLSDTADHNVALSAATMPAAVTSASKQVPKSPTAQNSVIKQSSSASKASFQLTSASYEIQETDLGKALEIAISIANVGALDGKPNVLEIELVDHKESSLMTWPLILPGSPIPAGSQTVYRTRVMEPPQDFTNIHVSMRAP